MARSRPFEPENAAWLLSAPRDHARRRRKTIQRPDPLFQPPAVFGRPVFKAGVDAVIYGRDVTRPGRDRALVVAGGRIGNREHFGNRARILVAFG